MYTYSFCQDGGLVDRLLPRFHSFVSCTPIAPPSLCIRHGAACVMERCKWYDIIACAMQQSFKLITVE